MISTPLELKDVIISGGFWKNKMEVVRTEVIPYQWKALNDTIEEAEPSYCMHNYQIAGKILQKEIERKVKKDWIFQPLPKENNNPENTFYGFAFQDSDFAKWIEAVSYSLIQHPDKSLERIADQAIDIVCAAQQENGYLDTYFIIRNPEAIFTNLRDYHELYCFGHLTEGAVAYYQATGKDKLLQTAKRYADYIIQNIGPEENKKHGYPGHEEAELALVKLYQVTKDIRYLKQAKYFIDERGKKPYYFDLEH
ncbi:MAG: glycoside hydrolase family 127 protein, partial [Lachnospiraceae bacterium]|nr:glycoside hydrolase family 127 protein [Lachnospiraceae bacterium]